jgi:hypothetical protein
LEPESLRKRGARFLRQTAHQEQSGTADLKFVKSGATMCHELRKVGTGPDQLSVLGQLREQGATKLVRFIEQAADHRSTYRHANPRATMLALQVHRPVLHFRDRFVSVDQDTGGVDDQAIRTTEYQLAHHIPLNGLFLLLKPRHSLHAVD